MGYLVESGDELRSCNDWGRGDVKDNIARVLLCSKMHLVAKLKCNFYKLACYPDSDKIKEQHSNNTAFSVLGPCPKQRPQGWLWPNAAVITLKNRTFQPLGHSQHHWGTLGTLGGGRLTG